jgi:hypothetical protein
MCYLYSTAAKQRGTVRSWNRLLSTEEQLAYYWYPPVPSVKTVQKCGVNSRPLTELTQKSDEVELHCHTKTSTPFDAATVGPVLGDSSSSVVEASSSTAETTVGAVS